jgi:hypothetical protein
MARAGGRAGGAIFDEDLTLYAYLVCIGAPLTFVQSRKSEGEVCPLVNIGAKRIP